jgi:hypothetical protein
MTTLCGSRGSFVVSGMSEVHVRYDSGTAVRVGKGFVRRR